MNASNDDNLPALVDPTLVDAYIDPNRVKNTQYLGQYNKAERRRSVRRSYSVRVTEEMDAAIDRLVQDSRVGYNNDVGFLVGHSIYLLLEAYVDMGYPDTELGAELLHEKRVRTDAELARKRGLYIDSLHQYDDELEYARRNEDWQSIDDHLAILESYLEMAPTAAAKQRVFGAASSSFSLQQAVVYLDDLAREDDSIPKKVRKRAERWRSYLEDVKLDRYHIDLAIQ